MIEKTTLFGAGSEVITDKTMDLNTLFGTKLRKLKPKKKGIKEYLGRYLRGD